MPETTERFETWALVEIMGHKQLAGLVRETTLAGAGMLRVDVPAVPGEPGVPGRSPGRDGMPAFTKLLSPSAIYAITPVQEDVVRRMAASLREQPVEVWRLDACRALPPAQVAEVEEEDEDEPRCRVCGCTTEHGCPEGCWWVEDPEHLGDLCSVCADRQQQADARALAQAVALPAERTEVPPASSSPDGAEIPVGAPRPCPDDRDRRGSKCEHYRADARCAETSSREPDRRCIWMVPVHSCPLGRTYGDVADQPARCRDCPATTPDAPTLSEPCSCWMPF